MSEYEDKFKKIVDGLNIDDKPSFAHREKLGREVTSTFSSAKDKTPHLQTTSQPLRRTIMKNRITKFAAAAVIIIGVLLGLEFIGGPSTTSVAWAEVLEQIYNAQSVIYKETDETDEYTFTHEHMINATGVKRSVLEHGNIIIFDSSSLGDLQYHPDSGRAHRSYQVGRKRTAGMKVFNYLNFISKLHEKQAQFMGTEELNGQVVDVHINQDPFNKITVWVNQETNLPVKIEWKYLANEEKNIVAPSLSLSLSDFGGEDSRSDGIGMGGGKGIQKNRTRTMFDFQWNVELDESLFSLKPPDGYSVTEEHIYDDPIEEDDLVYILSLWARMRNSEFPTNSQLNDPESFKPLLIEKFDVGGDPEKELDLAMEEIRKILQGIYFIQKKKADDNWNYAGDGVQFGDAETPICWWVSEDPESYRVIYGDLSIGDLSEIPQP